MIPLNQTDPQFWTAADEQHVVEAGLLELTRTDDYVVDSDKTPESEEDLLFGLGYIPFLLASSD